MSNNMLKINILSIALSGLIMMVSGGMIYLFKDFLTNGTIRYFLPIPPIAVAAYIFVFNLFKYQSSDSPAKLNLAVEMLMATLVSSSFFFIFIAVLILLIMAFK